MKFTKPKLVPCDGDGPERELYIVEGDSAARTLVRARNRATQAVLPMQGKPMNAMKASAAELHKNVQFGVLLDVLQVDLFQPEQEIPYQLLFDPERNSRPNADVVLFSSVVAQQGQIFDAHVVSVRKTGLSTPGHLKKIRAYRSQDQAIPWAAVSELIERQWSTRRGVECLGRNVDRATAGCRSVRVLEVRVTSVIEWLSRFGEPLERLLIQMSARFCHLNGSIRIFGELGTAFADDCLELERALRSLSTVMDGHRNIEEIKTII